MANALAGNAADLATLEITLVGPEVVFDDARVVAATGASFDLTVDGTAVPMQTAFAVSAGSRLKFGRRRNGARAYLAVSGGISVPPVLGSRATHVTSAMGGINGRAVKAGDRLPLGAQNASRQLGLGARGPQRDGIGGNRRDEHGVEGSQVANQPARLRVLPGPQLDVFEADALRILQAGGYTVDQKSDRMGFRLSGPLLVRRATEEMISDATPMGTLQVLPSGLPLLLMADRQTTGGYPQIATVISADLHIAGQLAPGDAVSFHTCTHADAIAALIAQERVLLDVESRWTP
jgi:biotin-dependent carboxylase-like uncharacterized protein